MISVYGRKVFFIYPPEALKGHFLKEIFKDEYETYLMNSLDKIEKILDIFKDAIAFFNIDVGLKRGEWITYIENIKKDYPELSIGVITQNDSNSLRTTYLMDIGITGGFVILNDNTWKGIEKINKVLEANEARGRRKYVRFDFDKKSNEHVPVKIYSVSGMCYTGVSKSFSAAGILVSIDEHSVKFNKDELIDLIIFKLGDHEFRVKGFLLKEVHEHNYFLSFKEIEETQREFVQEFIFDSLQNSFEKLLNTL